MSCLCVVGDGEGHVRRSRLRAHLPQWLVAVRVESSAFAGSDGGIFYPEFEAPVGAN